MASQTFSAVGTTTFVVPTFVNTLTVEVAGAAGGGSLFASGGSGGLLTGIIPVTPGETLTITVGGLNGTPGGGAAGTAGTGGAINNVGGAGGGYSIIRHADTSPVAVAGGGGGAGGGSSNSVGGDGGAGGGTVGVAGSTGANTSGSANPPGTGGGGGTASAGGAAGTGAPNGIAGVAGSSGAGGHGGDGVTGAGWLNSTGGGGGGGYFGGGGGGDSSGSTVAGNNGGGGGGGGSSFIIGGSTNVAHTQGARSGNGYITLTWGSPQSAAPTNITPVAGAIVASNTPILGMTIVAQGAAKQRGQWNLSTGSDFVANLKTITEPTSDFRISGPTTEPVTLADRLTNQTTWYIRGRTLDEGDVGSPWSPVQSFTVSNPPSASPISPFSGETIAYSAVGMSLSWQFSPLENQQTAYQVVISDNATGAVVVDSGKVSSVAKTYSVIIPTTKKNATLNWKVRVYDNDNVVSPYTSPVVFSVADAPGITVTSPGTVATSAPIITYTFTPVGIAQLAQRRVTITRNSDGAQVYDSGWGHD